MSLQQIIDELKQLNQKVEGLSSQIGYFLDEVEKREAEKHLKAEEKKQPAAFNFPTEVGDEETPKKGEEQETKWRPTKNPEIEWCPEKDAVHSDLEQAFAKSGGMWTSFNEEYGYSLFRKVKKK